jgi:hypothetical protein
MTISFRFFGLNPCSGNISKMRPFGHALQYSLENARIDNENPDMHYGLRRTIVPHH